MRTPSFKYFLFILIISIALFPLGSLADVKGKMIAYHCYSCHGEKLKNLNLPRPVNKKTLINTLLAFKYDKTMATVMNRISKGYTDSEIEAVAAYLSHSK